MGDPVYASGYPLPFGAADYPEPFAFVIYSGVDPLNLGAYEGLAYLLTGTPFDVARTPQMPAPPIPFGDIDYPTPFALQWTGAAAQIWPAATIGRSTAPTDTPASIYVPAKLDLSGFNYGMELFSGADPSSAGSNTVGVLTLIDPDGGLDGLLSLEWNGAPLQLLRGRPSDPFASWNTVASITAAGILNGMRQKQIKLRDLAHLLNAAPLHGNYYGGTGGLDGDASLVGTIKPYAVGPSFNVTPVLISSADLIYQVSFTAVQSVIAKDGGAALTLDGDDPDFATLKAATIGTGHYRTCKALGLYRMGGKPLLIATADVVGDATTYAGHPAPMTRGQVARRIATGLGTIRLDDVTGLDNASFTALEVKQPATCGWYWNSEITKAAALSEVMAGCLGFWFVRLSGQLAVGLCEDPGVLTPQLTLSAPAPGSGEVRIGEPEMTDYQSPTRQTFIGFQRNYTVLQTNQVAGVLDLNTSSILQNATQYASSTDAWATNSYPAGNIVKIDSTGFAYRADAQAETDRQQALRRVRRQRFSMPAVVDPLGDFCGGILRLAALGRMAMGSARNFLCCGMSAQGGQVKLELWG
ncbi:hypothetical protein [Nitrobacter sp.]|uniref:hypothetical protein n=1 Tax=Nitrobacter sp. TaxID=29420 RepID=UPI0029CAB80E|nr:hypothetical protein [Nitrobacter sp.]